MIIIIKSPQVIQHRAVPSLPVPRRGWDPASLQTESPWPPGSEMLRPSSVKNEGWASLGGRCHGFSLHSGRWSSQIKLLGFTKSTENENMKKMSRVGEELWKRRWRNYSESECVSLKYFISGDRWGVDMVPLSFPSQEGKLKFLLQYNWSTFGIYF